MEKLNNTCSLPFIYGIIKNSGFQAAVDTPPGDNNTITRLLIIPQGRINSRMTSYLKIFVLIDFHFQDAIFPFNRAAPYGMTSAVPREQSRTSARSAERTLALDPCPHSSAAARASLMFLVRSATERRTSRGEISFQLPFKRYPIKNFGSNRADKSENFPLRGVHSCLKGQGVTGHRIDFNGHRVEIF